MLTKRRTAAAVLAAAAALPACHIGSGGSKASNAECRKATVAAEPGRVVDVGGKQSLELRARLTDGAKPLAGAPLSFVLNHRKADGTNLSVIAGEQPTSADGVAVYQQALDTLAVDVRAEGPLQPTYKVEWRFPPPLNGVQYCSGAKGEAAMPVDQLPKG